MFLVIVLDKSFDSVFCLLGQVGPAHEFLDHRQFLVQVGGSRVDGAYRRGQVTDRKRIEPDAKDHPDQCETPFLQQVGVDVPVSNSGQGL